MTRTMIREAITRLLSMIAVETIPQTRRQGITKTTDGDTILGSSSLLLQLLCVLRWIRGDLTNEDQFLEEELNLLITIDLILDRGILAMTSAAILAFPEMRLLGFRPIQGHREMLVLILDSSMKVHGRRMRVLICSGRIPPPIEGRPREPLDSRRPLSGREYPRMSSREVDIPPSLESAVLSKMPEDSSVLARGGPRKNIADLGPDPFGNGVRAALDPRADEPSSYRYDRERPPPSERYRDAGDYGRDPYMAYEGRGRGLLPRDIRDAPYGRPRDSGAPYEDYPPLATESRARDTYPSRGPPPLDYSRIAAQEERYSRGPPVDLEPPRGRESGYRDLPGRSFDSGQKRRYDGDYVDRYGEDLRVHLFGLCS